MPSIEDLQTAYEALDDKMETVSEDSINSEMLIAFDYEYPGSDSNISIERAGCPAGAPGRGVPRFGGEGVG